MNLDILGKRSFYYILLATIVIFGCKSGNRQLAKEKADSLMEMIANGNPVEEFPVTYFPIDKTTLILKDLKYKCDFKSRKGGFVNELYTSKVNEDDKITFVYNFQLKCDTVTMKLTYNLGKNIELYGFSVQKINLANPDSR